MAGLLLPAISKAKSKTQTIKCVSNLKQISISTHLFVNHRLTTALLGKIQQAGIPAVEIFCARQHFDYRDKSQVNELGYWFRDAQLKCHSLHSPMFNDDCGGRTGPSAVISITELSKPRRLECVDEIKRALEAAENGVRINAVAPSIALHDFLKKAASSELLDQLTSREAFGRARSAHESLIVEGAGGLLSPLGEDFDSRDLITTLRATPIIVCPNRLGAVNLLRLTLAALPRAAARAEQPETDERQGQTAPGGAQDRHGPKQALH